MPHPVVEQLRFTRSEWLRGLEGLTEGDAMHHFGPMNSISWTVGHLAWQEQRYFLERAQGQVLFPELNTVYAFGAPMTTPTLADGLRMWHAVTAATEPYLDAITTATLLADLPFEGRAVGQSVGSALRRTTYHYWYHIGEIQATRQLLGHADLPVYVGSIEREAPYRPE